jgi:metal-responsive CopG/Arc/MetJ family transcriptional regulator
MTRNNYRSITLPEGLYHELEKYLKASKGHYITVSEIVREALRDFFKKQQSDG